MKAQGISILILSMAVTFLIIGAVKSCGSSETNPESTKEFKTIDAPEQKIERYQSEESAKEEEDEPKRSSVRNPDKENAEVFILTTVNNKIVKCPYARMTNCGVVLKGCDDGNDYYCLQGVIVP
jgi:hypothetical protein